jgi:TetR/AcrR family transcriptional regulator, cholesterol catabolism regulator
MPPTRPQVSRDQKMGEILELAEASLREGGYEALSVAGIARKLGLAQNAVYWYFPSKDHLFVATLERMLRDIAARKPRHDVDRVDRILWFTDQFEPLSHLRPAMNERAGSSEVVRQFVDELEALLQRMLANTLGGEVPEKDLPLAVQTFRATVEGTMVKGMGKRERRKVLRFALAQLGVR